MNISLFGLGYVGCVNVACLSKLGHKLVAVDIVQDKIDKLNSKIPTVSEPKLGSILSKYKSNYRATSSVEEAVQNSDVAMLCINTPNDTNGNLDISILEKCVKDISTYLSNFLSRGNNDVLLSDRVNSFINNKWIDTTPMIVDKILSNAL